MMKKILLFLVACVALAALKAFALVIAGLLALALVTAFIMHPRYTVVFLVTLALSALTVSQPLACIVALAVASSLIAWAVRRRPRPQTAALETGRKVP